MGLENRIISIDELYGVYKEANHEELIIDLRTSTDYRQLHIEDSLNIPFNRLQLSSFNLRKIKRAYLVCKRGSEAPMGAKEMNRLYPDVEVYYVASGGLDEWTEKKYPIIFSTNSQREQMDDGLGQNEPDYINVKKLTRLLPIDRRDTIEKLLSEIMQVYFFVDQDRSCYLVVDRERKKAMVLNPLVEIHHHLIDQLVRSDCECELTLYDADLTYENSPSPLTHAKDFSSLVGSPYYSLKELKAVDLQPWSKALTAITQ